MNTTILISILAELPLDERLGDSNETVTLGELIVKIMEAVFTLEMNGALGVWVLPTLVIFFLILFLFFVLVGFVVLGIADSSAAVLHAVDNQADSSAAVLHAVDKQNKKLDDLNEQLEKLVDKEVA